MGYGKNTEFDQNYCHLNHYKGLPTPRIWNKYWYRACIYILYEVNSICSYEKKNRKFKKNWILKPLGFLNRYDVWCDFSRTKKLF